MKKETLEMIHKKYNQAAQDATNIMEILNNLYVLLCNYVPCEEDIEEYEGFLRRVDTSRRIREKTFQMTNLVSDLCFTIMYVVIWANATQGADIDISITARRKSLESELSKLLEKDWDYDRFGVRIIILNNNSEDETIRKKKIFDVNRYIVDILTKTNRKLVNDFSSWLIESAEVEEFTRQRVLYAVNLPLKTTVSKDYVTNPKSNGYQSLHTVLEMEMYSEKLPGAEFELQLRDCIMHQTAENGSANHNTYKSSSSKYRWVFTLDSFENIHISGFSGYDIADIDLDGLHRHKDICARRISKSLVHDHKY